MISYTVLFIYILFYNNFYIGWKCGRFMGDKEMYEAARENSSLRKEFLKRVDMGEYAPYVSKVSYRGKGFGKVMCTNFSVFPWKNPKSKVGVYQDAFEMLDWDSFRNMLHHHEGFHAKSLYEGKYSDWKDKMGFIAEGFLSAGSKSIKRKYYLEEIGAYLNQILHPSFDECPNSYRMLVRYRAGITERWLAKFGD